MDSLLEIVSEALRIDHAAQVAGPELCREQLTVTEVQEVLPRLEFLFLTGVSLPEEPAAVSGLTTKVQRGLERNGRGQTIVENLAALRRALGELCRPYVQTPLRWLTRYHELEPWYRRYDGLDGVDIRLMLGERIGRDLPEVRFAELPIIELGQADFLGEACTDEARLEAVAEVLGARLRISLGEKASLASGFCRISAILLSLPFEACQPTRSVFEILGHAAPVGRRTRVWERTLGLEGPYDYVLEKRGMAIACVLSKLTREDWRVLRRSIMRSCFRGHSVERWASLTTQREEGTTE